MLNSNLAGNLKLLCAQQSSIAHVCRSIKINRQQFNKYLNATVYPSEHNLEKICRYFRIDQKTLNLPEKEFRKKLKVRLKADVEDTQDIPDLNEYIDSLPNAIDLLDRYTGYYYSHSYAMGYPGYLVRRLIHLYRHKDRFYTKSVEHLWDKENETSHRNRFKYRGLTLYLADRIFLTEHETLNSQVICQTVLFPNYRNSIDYISGITIGVGSLSSHVPKAARVEYQYLGESIDIKKTIRGCGLFKAESLTICGEIRQRISNVITDDEYVLAARDQ